MNWRELLQKEDESLVFPWVGGRTVRAEERAGVGARVGDSAQLAVEVAGAAASLAQRVVRVRERARALPVAEESEREHEEPSHHTSSFAIMAPPCMGAIANGGGTSRRCRAPLYR